MLNEYIDTELERLHIMAAHWLRVDIFGWGCFHVIHIDPSYMNEFTIRHDVCMLRITLRSVVTCSRHLLSFNTCNYDTNMRNNIICALLNYIIA